MTLLWAELLGMPVTEIRTTRPGHEVKEIYRGKPSEGQVKLTFFKECVNYVTFRSNYVTYYCQII